VEIYRYLNILRRHVFIVVLCVAVAVAAAWFKTPQKARYSAQATIYVGARQFSVSPAQGLSSSDLLTTAQRLILTYAKMIDSLPTAQDAVQKTSVDRSADRVVAETKALTDKDTQLLTVVVTDPDPRVAQDLANGISDAFVAKVQTFEPSAAPSEGEVPALPAYIFEKAKLPGAPQPTGLLRNLLLAGILGFAIGAGMAYLRDYLDLTIRSVADAEHRLELPVLGVIPMGPQPLTASTAAPRRSAPGAPRDADLIRQRG